MTIRRTAIILIVLLALPILGLTVLSVMSKAPQTLGVTNGRLAACPDSPNCVSTQATDDAHHMDPIPYDGTTPEAMKRIRAVVGAMPRTRIVTERDDYLHAEFTSLVFRFVDDVEFYIDEDAKVIHFRSASRAGRSDFGVNRKRMEQIGKALVQ